MMDGELLEKVNLDQSSADEMEEDDTKLVEPDISSRINKSNKEPGVGMGDRLHHFTPTDKLELSNDHIEKRKFQGTSISLF